MLPKVNVFMKRWLIPVFSFILSFVFIGISWAQASGDIPTIISDDTAISIGLALAMIGMVAIGVRKTSRYDIHVADTFIHGSVEERSNKFILRNECALTSNAIMQRLNDISAKINLIGISLDDVRHDVSATREDLAQLKGKLKE